MALKMPNGHKFCQHLRLQGNQKFTQFVIFGFKMVCHLATLFLLASVSHDNNE
jgi:hypothetical protein